MARMQVAIPADLAQWLREQEAAALNHGQRVPQSGMIRAALREWKMAGRGWKDASGA
jgi:Arc/MetJ-type ribon-helix-helix transcriptional regulator